MKKRQNIDQINQGVDENIVKISYLHKSTRTDNTMVKREKEGQINDLHNTTATAKEGQSNDPHNTTATAKEGQRNDPHNTTATINQNLQN